MRKIILSIGCVLMAAYAMAAIRTVSEAEQIAATFFCQQTADGSRKMAAEALELTYTQMQKDRLTPAVYVFHHRQSGCVLLSADDRTVDVLGYTDSGVWPEQLPEGLQFMLERYAEQITTYNLQSTTYNLQSATYQYVAPLLKTTWGQDSPFNRQTPEINGQHCPTGCVATAIAQIMKYHQWPIKGTGKLSYRWNRQTLVADFEHTTYQWDKMKNSYNRSYTTEQADAVAILMAQLGIAAEMEYTLEGSGTNSQLLYPALYNNLGYDKELTIKYVDGVGVDTALDLIQSNLLKGWPVYMTGTTDHNEGHAFVCDGIQEDGKVHINWGWDGICDGNFSLSALNPMGQGTGGSAGDDAFTHDIELGLNIHPDQGGTPADPFLMGEWLDMPWGKEGPQSRNYMFAMSYVLNYGMADANGKMILGLYKDNQRKKVLYSDESECFSAMDYYYNNESTYSCTAQASFSNLAEGQYIVKWAWLTGSGHEIPVYAAGGEAQYELTIRNDSAIFAWSGSDVPDYTIRDLQLETSENRLTTSWNSDAPLFYCQVMNKKRTEVLMSEYITDKTWSATLSNGTYYFCIAPCNENQQRLADLQLTKFTIVSTDIEDVSLRPVVNKWMEKGQLYIRKNGKTYTILGKEIAH
ncbi:MAG: C10 family peptidase [Paludibacteraceae bacterium]|nr:C10 family peptidase [Paludibacteraceae bacterium]